MSTVVPIYVDVHLPIICVCGCYTMFCWWNLILPFLGMKYYLGIEKYFGVAIVAPPVNHFLPTILGGNGLPRYSLPGS